MRLSLVFLSAARRGAACFVAVKQNQISLASLQGSVDQRKSPSWQALPRRH
jgi:hypothetical protein